MAVKRFEDLLVGQKAQDFSVAINKNYGAQKEYAFKNQITRVSVSSSNTIAEGFDRNNNPDFLRFLNISTSSNSEVRFMLYLSKRLGYVEEQKVTPLIEKSNEIPRML